MDESLFSIDKFLIKINEKTGTIGKDNEESVNYYLELMLSESILQIRFGLPNEAEKYKNNYTLQKFMHKAPKLDYYYENIKQLRDKLSELFSSKNFEIQVFEEKYFTYLKFHFDLFENSIHNFDLELFLYKSDSNYSRILVNNLTEKLEEVINKNKELEERQKSIFDKLKGIREGNDSILSQINIIHDSQSTKFNELIDTVTETTEIQLGDLENSVANIKNELINAGVDLRKSSKYVYMPILRTEDKKMLHKWFEKDFELILAYDSSKNGDTASSFHEKCDGKIQTLTLVETENGRRFGGYCKLPWDATENFKKGDKSAFIFSLDKHLYLPIQDEEYTIFCSAKAGPKFGKHDIVISDEFTKNCNSYSCVFNSYGRKEEFSNIENSNATSLLAGIEFFNVRKIEVFQVIFK